MSKPPSHAEIWSMIRGRLRIANGDRLCLACHLRSLSSTANQREKRPRKAGRSSSKHHDRPEQHLRTVVKHVDISNNSHDASQALRLVKVVGSQPEARNEVRWMKEYIQARSPDGTTIDAELERLVAQRETGKPLQYVLGTQPFGELEILCRPDVLIPRSVASILNVCPGRYQADHGLR